MKLPAGVALSDEQVASLKHFSRLLRDRAVPLGLVSPRDAERVWDRHVVDSLRAVPLFGEADHTAVDIGSGAGLPGIPLAIALPGCEFELVEPKARRVGFLELAIERLGLRNARVAHARSEEFAGRVDIATARAFGDVDASWAAAYPLLRRGGRLIYFAGAGVRDAAARARRAATPEPPADVFADAVLESATPLVIMVRG